MRLIPLFVVISVICAGETYLDNISPAHPAIRYASAPVDERITRLVSGRNLPPTGDLPALLQTLSINTDSQALVFARDSFQADKISPRNPRAIYFNDDTLVGFVPGGKTLEIALIDSRQGALFYTLEPATSRFTRQEVCLRCHQGPATLGIPGIFVGSVFPNADGAHAREGAIITDHRTPFADRWGGWFVDAASGKQKDRANAAALDPSEPGRLEPIPRLFDRHAYPAATSDIVALMTLEHQTQVTNLLIRLNWEARTGSGDPDIEPLVRYLLFNDEVLLPEPLVGVSTFARTFPQRGPRDSLGRSLRDFDLRSRLFRYPLSYMIYSRIFDGLTEPTKQRVYLRIYAELVARNRKDVIDILSATKPGVPNCFRLR